MAAPTLEHNHSFKFPQSSPLDTLVRRTSSRRARSRAVAASADHSAALTHSSSLYTSNAPVSSPPRQPLHSQSSPDSPLLHTQFRGSMISANTYRDNSFLDQSLSMVGDQSQEAENGIYPDDVSVYATPSMPPPPHNAPSVDPQVREILEAFTGATSHTPPTGTYRVDHDDESLPTVVISPAADHDFRSPAMQPTRGGKVPIAVPARFNFSRPGRPPALPPADQKKAVLERNAGRHHLPVAFDGKVNGPFASMPNLLPTSQPLVQRPGLPGSSQSYRDTSHPSQSTHTPSSFYSATDIPIARPASQTSMDHRLPSSGRPLHPAKPVTPITLEDMCGSGYPRVLNSYGSSYTTTAQTTKPSDSTTPDFAQHPNSREQASIRSISIYSNSSSAEHNPAVGQQLFSDRADIIPFDGPLIGTTGVAAVAPSRFGQARGKGIGSEIAGYSSDADQQSRRANADVILPHAESLLPNPYAENPSTGYPPIVLGKWQASSANVALGAVPSPTTTLQSSGRPSHEHSSSGSSWRSRSPYQQLTNQMSLSFPVQSQPPIMPTSLSSGIALATSYLAQNSSTNLPSAVRTRRDPDAHDLASRKSTSRSDQQHDQHVSDGKQQQPRLESNQESTLDLFNSHRSPSNSSMHSHRHISGPRYHSPDFELPSEPSHRPAQSTTPRKRVELPRGPPSRAVSPAASVYSQYSFYQLDNSSRGSPTGSAHQLLGESGTLRSSPSDEARPGLLSPTYTPATRPPGAVRFASDPITPPTDSRTAQDFLQLGIQHHENNRLRDAAWCFERSAKESGGCGVGMVMWGLTLRHGWGIEKNEPLGFKWLQKAAESAVSDLESTRKGVDTHAVQDEMVIAIYEVGQCFFQGWGVRKDLKMAVSYYTVAAKLGDPDAQHDLGFCLANGKGCKKDRKEAAKWHRAAIAQGASDVGMAWVYKEKFQ